MNTTKKPDKSSFFDFFEEIGEKIKDSFLVDEKSTLKPNKQISQTHLKTNSHPHSTPPLLDTGLPFKEHTDSRYHNRLKSFEDVVNSPTIDLNFLRILAFEGIPDSPIYLRPTIWKIFLKFLPTDTSLWENSLKESQKIYQSYLRELVSNPFDNPNSQSQTSINTHDNTPPPLSPVSTSPLPMTNIILGDDPLSLNPQNKWKEFFDDEELRIEIKKDISRTHAYVNFFRQSINGCKIVNDSFDDTSIETQTTLFVHPRCHQDVLGRILFIYAKLHPQILYAQGMNEILSPLYYVFCHEYSLKNLSESEIRQKYFEAEICSFFCFSNLMSEIQDRFILLTGKSKTGILQIVQNYHDLLRIIDPHVWYHLHKYDVDPRYYALRWLTLLLSQTFELPDTIRLWDSLFSDEIRFNFLDFFCVSMVVLIRKSLLSSDFANILHALQEYPHLDLHVILQTAYRLRSEYSKSPKNRHLTNLNKQHFSSPFT